MAKMTAKNISERTLTASSITSAKRSERGSPRGNSAVLAARAGRQRTAESKDETERLDRMIHEQMRLGIVSALAVNDTLSFTDLKDLLKTTDGNLSVHARKLEEAEYIHCSKSFSGRQPRTEYRLSALGRRALDRYLDQMEALIRSARTR